MNLKYYLRGLGTGILVTAILMGIALGGKKETLSDNEIRERARALGMTEESTRLADVATASPGEEETTKPDASATPEAEATAEPTEEPAAEATAEPDASATPEAEATAEPTEEAAAEPTEEPTPEATPESADGTITIQVDTGDDSYAVCQKLEEAGLILSASDFNRYLYDNGYDKRINVGTYEIPEGTESEQIAKIIARME